IRAGELPRRPAELDRLRPPLRIPKRRITRIHEVPEQRLHVLGVDLAGQSKRLSAATLPDPGRFALLGPLEVVVLLALADLLRQVPEVMPWGDRERHRPDLPSRST